MLQEVAMVYIPWEFNQLVLGHSEEGIRAIEIRAGPSDSDLHVLSREDSDDFLPVLVPLRYIHIIIAKVLVFRVIRAIGAIITFLPLWHCFLDLKSIEIGSCIIRPIFREIVLQ